jgi:DNA-directed RNA polymerase specialized sigma24 family protein
LGPTEHQALPDWQAILFDPSTDLLGRLDAMARRRFWDENDALQAVDFALDVLQANDWQTLAGFRGAASPSTFVTSVALRLFEDFHRRRYARCRPPRWIVSLGSPWQEAFELLCCRHLEPADAAARLAGRFEASEWTEDALLRLSRTVRSRVVDCRQRDHVVSMDTPDRELADRLETTASQSESPEESIDTAEQLAALVALAELLGSPLPDGMEVDADWVGRLHARIRVSDEDRTVLRLVFQGGIPLAEVARMLDTPYRRLRKRLDSVLEHLKDVLAGRSP